MNRPAPDDAERENARRSAAALGDLDQIMAICPGKSHRDAQRAIDALGRLDRLIDFGAVASGRAGQSIHNDLRRINLRLIAGRRIGLLA